MMLIQKLIRWVLPFKRLHHPCTELDILVELREYHIVTDSVVELQKDEFLNMFRDVVIGARGLVGGL